QRPPHTRMAYKRSAGDEGERSDRDQAAKMHDGREQKRVHPPRPHASQKIAGPPHSNRSQAISSRNVLSRDRHWVFEISTRPERTADWCAAVAAGIVCVETVLDLQRDLATGN